MRIYRPLQTTWTLRSHKSALCRPTTAPWRCNFLRAMSDTCCPVLDEQSSAPNDRAPNKNSSIRLNRSTAKFHERTDIPSCTAALRSEKDDHDQDEKYYDMDFISKRMGLTMASEYENHQMQFHDDIREESRAEATIKAERILAILRHSMTEIDIGKVIHRVAQFSTLPRPSGVTLKQFKRSLENLCTPVFKQEFEYLWSFLEGRDEVLDALQDRTLHGDTSYMGLHLDLMADPKFIATVFIYCRYACLNALQLIKNPRNPSTRSGGKLSSLSRVKHDFRQVLDMEEMGKYADMMGLEKDEQPDVNGTGTTASHVMLDPEWEEFNLENNRIDFRHYQSQLHGFIATMKDHLSDRDISKMLVAMLASVKTSKLHRKIFQEMVCNIQTVLPADAHEAVLSQLVPFLSGNAATLRDFDSITSTNALQHHRYRHEAILRSMLECRMRCSHILIHDIDDIEEASTIGSKLTPEQREKVRTTAWNIVSLLDDRRYHVFFSRFLRYKLAWRPNRTNFDDIFLENIRTIFAPDDKYLMPGFSDTYQDLSVETLTICRVRARHARNLVRQRASMQILNAQGQERVEHTWRPERSVIYSNLPFNVAPQHLRAALSHIGTIKQFIFFSHPVDGPPEEIAIRHKKKKVAVDKVDDSVDDDERSDSAVSVDLDVEVEDEQDEIFPHRSHGLVLVDDQSDDASDDAHQEKKRPGRKKDLFSPKKNMIIASNVPTEYSVLIEFENASQRDRAMQRALQIFGVMIEGWKEHRAAFSSGVENRRTLCLQHIPYGTTCRQVLDQVNTMIRAAGLAVEVHSDVPEEAIIANGRMDLCFESFVEVVQVMDALQCCLRKMKRRTPLTPEEASYKRKREKMRCRYEEVTSKAMLKAEREAKKAARAGGEEDSMMDVELQSFLSPELAHLSMKMDPYDEVDEAEMTEKEIERHGIRPFEVTFNRPRQESNKHLYV